MDIYSAAQMIIAALVAGSAGGVAGAWFMARHISISVVLKATDVTPPPRELDSEMIRDWCARCGIPQPMVDEIDELIAASRGAK